MTNLKLEKGGYKVEFFSMVLIKRSHSVCAQWRINTVINAKGKGDSSLLHFYETI